MPLQSVSASGEKGLCILSLDAGGSRGISQLTILDHLMYRLNQDTRKDPPERPCSVFGMIGGVGSGGFIAILLVVFGLTVANALEEFTNLSVNILDKQDIDAETRTVALRKYVDDLLVKYEINSILRLLDVNSRSKGCKLAVAISYKSNAGSICMLRNYSSRQEQTPNLTIAEAVLATLATPPLFTSTQILKNAAKFDYIGADWTVSNPTQEIITEAHEAFGADEKVACLLSVGCGRAGIISTPEGSSMAEWNQLVDRLVMDGERKAESLGSQMGQLGLHQRFSVTHGLSREGTTTNTATPGVVSQHTQVYLGELQVEQQVEACTNALRLRPKIASLHQLRYLGARHHLLPQLPPLTKTFVMRKKPWEFIERALLSERNARSIFGPRMLFVTGIGGCGKTQLMLRFMTEHQSRFVYQFFIDGSSEDRIRNDIVRNVHALGTEHSQKAFEECILFLSQPSQSGQSLLLYDNVDDPNLDLYSLLPRGNACAIAITSRNHVLGELDPEAHLPLDIMSVEEATELLLHGSTPSAIAADQIRKDLVILAEALGRLPIALQQACAYMRQTKCSASAYLSRLSGNKSKLLGQGIKHQVDMQSISTYAAFEMSFEKLPVTSQKLLRLLSYFHWAGFPLELINLAARGRFSNYHLTLVDHGDDFYTGKELLEGIFLRGGEWEVTNLDETIISLQNYSMVTLTQGVDTILAQMHPLAHEWVQEYIPTAEKHEYQCGAILLLALGGRYERTASTQYLASHVLHMTRLWNDLHVNYASAFGLILKGNGIYRGALRLQEAVLKLMKEILGERHPDTTWASANLASTYLDLGRIKEAEVLQEEILRLRKENLGERHPDTIKASNNLAGTYRGLGRLNEAEVLQKEALKSMKEILGERHPDTISASNNLAITYHDLGKLKEAEVLQEEVLKLRKEILGERHPDTIRTSSSLAVTYCGLGRLGEAEVLQEEVLKLSKEILGERHPDTIGASGNLAVTYRNLGKMNEAEVLQEEVLKLRKKILGERHPDTIQASNNLANIYGDLGRLNEAEVLQEEVLKLRKEILGERHPDTISAMNNLALTYRDLGRLNEAEVLQEMALKLSKEVLGGRHPITLTVLSNLETTRHKLQQAGNEERHQVNDSPQALLLPPVAPSTSTSTHAAPSTNTNVISHESKTSRVMRKRPDITYEETDGDDDNEGPAQTKKRKTTAKSRVNDRAR